ncbi:MAG: toprim domain-containing protein [bacterium]|nr:toprim domain-containing protein [bacterium]
MTDLKELLDFEIYPNLNRLELLADLRPADHGGYLLLTCPSCGKREAYLYQSSTVIQCNRLNKCGARVSLWDYYQQKTSASNREVLQEFARLAGVPLTRSAYSEEQWRNAQLRAKVMEAAHALFQKSLWESAGKPTLTYLRTRGYSDEEIRSMGLGCYVPREALKVHLVNCGYEVNIVNVTEFGLSTNPRLGKTHTLAIPYRDPVGRLKGFIVRTIGSDDPKYLFTAGVEKSSLFNLRGQKSSEIIVTEGFLDALLASARGMLNVCATGGAQLTETQVENAKRYGVNRVILALDSDEAGQAGTERSIKLLAKMGVAAFVLPLPPPFKDPDEYIRAEGIPAFQSCVTQAARGVRWMAARLVQQYDMTTDRGLQEAVDAALTFDRHLSDPLDREVFWHSIQSTLSIHDDTLQALLSASRERNRQEQLAQRLQGVVRETQGMLREGKAESVPGFLERIIAKVKPLSAPPLPAPYTFSQLQTDIQTTSEGLATGYPSLDKILQIPNEAITIIAGRPSHGKTTLLMNLCRNLVEQYPERRFLFFSYEETRKQLGLKFLTMYAGAIIDEARNLRQYENYLRGDNSGQPAIQQAATKFQSITETGRLLLVDEPYQVDDLANVLAMYTELFPVGAVFIDYIQKVRIQGKFATRQLELQKISERLLETAKSLRLPILLGAQLGRDKDSKDKVRLDNLREAGDIEQDANLVLGLFNPSLNKTQDEGGRSTARVVDLKVTVLKNRNGRAGDELTLKFDRPLWTISDQ